MTRELRLGQELYFVLWDEDGDEAGVAKGEVVQYAADYSKVRVRVVEAPQRTVIGRTTWVLPERLDDDPGSARRNYQRRAREQLRAEIARRTGAAENTGTGEEGTGVPGQAQTLWQRIAEGWRDIDLLVDTVDFEAGWPEHQSRLAKFAVVAVLTLRPTIAELLGALAGGEDAEAVRAALETGALGTAARMCASDCSVLLARWAEVPADEVATAADDITGLRSALAELAERHQLHPALEASAVVD